MKNLVHNLAALALSLAVALSLASCSSGGDKGPDGPTTVPITGVTVFPKDVIVAVNATTPLTAIVAPPNATDKAVAWTSSDATMATVGAATGIVTGVAAGTVTITATTHDGGKTDTCTVTVTQPSAGEPIMFLSGDFGLYIDGFHDAAVGNQKLRDVSVDAAGAVHAAGQIHDPGGDVEWRAAYFRDGAPTVLPTGHGADTLESGATAIFVSGNDVYISGYERFTNSMGYEGAVPRLWKNGGLVQLDDVDELGDTWSRATGVRLHNGVVWVVGYGDVQDEYGYYVNHPAIWKNGAKTFYQELDDYQIMDFAVTSDGALHLLCNNVDFYYWGVDPFIVFSVNPATMACSQETLLPLVSDLYQVPTHIFADGADVYLSGSWGDDACYWKNGVRSTLARPAGTNGPTAEDIHVLDGHVYIAGSAGYGSSGYGIVQWVDGAAVGGAKAVSDRFATWRASITYGMFVQQVARVPATGVTLDLVSLAVPLGYQRQLTATVQPGNATLKGVTWSSSNPAVAAVMGTGLTVIVEGVATGTATITATSPDGPLATCAVQVQTLAVTDVTLPATFSVGLNRTVPLTATLVPAEATNQNATWSSSAPGVVSVSGSGLTASVTGAASGSATITVTTQDGGRQASCQVTVTDPGAAVIAIAGDFGLYVDAAFATAIGAEAINDVCVDGDGHVHAVGVHYESAGSVHWYASYYRDGVRTLIQPTLPNPVMLTAHGVAVNGGNVYVVGVEEAGDSNRMARLWVSSDGGQTFAPSQLNGIDQTGSINSWARKVLCVGSDVYVAGGVVEGSAPSAAIWKNGTLHSFPDAWGYFTSFGVTAGGAIYAVVNSSGTAYAIPANLGSCTPVTLTGSGYPMALSVDGGDVYLAGYSGSEAYYWENGTRNALERPSTAYSVGASAVHAVGGHTYVVGRALMSSGGARVALWIDGAYIDDARAVATPFGWLFEDSVRAVCVKP
jgi:uncharacterized protein YjdB